MVHTLITAVAMAGLQSPPLTISVDGRAMELSYSTPALIQDDRVQLPMRAVFESLGAHVQYIPELRQVIATYRDREITMLLNENFAYVNGSQVLDYPPRVVNGNVYVPIRFVAEALGHQVRWDHQRRHVTVRTNSQL